MLGNFFDAVVINNSPLIYSPGGWYFLPSVASGLVFSADFSTGDSWPPPHSRPLVISVRAAASPVDKSGKDGALQPMTPEKTTPPTWVIVCSNVRRFIIGMTVMD